MKIVFDPRAAEELEHQIHFLIQQGAVKAAVKLEARVISYFERLLSRYPRTGKHIAEKDIWETWVPGTRLVVWYRFTTSELQIIRVWHSAQDRDA